MKSPTAERQFAELMQAHLEDGGMILAATHLPLGVRLDRQHTIVEIGGADVVTYRDMIRIAAERTGRSPVIVGLGSCSASSGGGACGSTCSRASERSCPAGGW